MELVSLNNEEDHGFILVDRSTGLPCIGATIYPIGLIEGLRWMLPGDNIYGG